MFISVVAFGGLTHCDRTATEPAPPPRAEAPVPAAAPDVASPAALATDASAQDATAAPRPALPVPPPADVPQILNDAALRDARFVVFVHDPPTVAGTFEKLLGALSAHLPPDSPAGAWPGVTAALGGPPGLLETWSAAGVDVAAGLALVLDRGRTLGGPALVLRPSTAPAAERSGRALAALLRDTRAGSPTPSPGKKPSPGDTPVSSPGGTLWFPTVHTGSAALEALLKPEEGGKAPAAGTPEPAQPSGAAPGEPVPLDPGAALAGLGGGPHLGFVWNLHAMIPEAGPESNAERRHALRLGRHYANAFPTYAGAVGHGGGLRLGATGAGVAALRLLLEPPTLGADLDAAVPANAVGSVRWTFNLGALLDAALAVVPAEDGVTVGRVYLVNNAFPILVGARVDDLASALDGHYLVWVGARKGPAGAGGEAGAEAPVDAPPGLDRDIEVALVAGLRDTVAADRLLDTLTRRLAEKAGLTRTAGPTATEPALDSAGAPKSAGGDWTLTGGNVPVRFLRRGDRLIIGTPGAVVASAQAMARPSTTDAEYARPDAAARRVLAARVHLDRLPPKLAEPLRPFREAARPWIPDDTLTLAAYLDGRGLITDAGVGAQLVAFAFGAVAFAIAAE